MHTITYSIALLSQLCIFNVAYDSLLCWPWCIHHYFGYLLKNRVILEILTLNGSDETDIAGFFYMKIRMRDNSFNKQEGNLGKFSRAPPFTFPYPSGHSVNYSHSIVRERQLPPPFKYWQKWMYLIYFSLERHVSYSLHITLHYSGVCREALDLCKHNSHLPRGCSR